VLKKHLIICPLLLGLVLSINRAAAADYLFNILSPWIRRASCQRRSRLCRTKNMGRDCSNPRLNYFPGTSTSLADGARNGARHVFIGWKEAATNFAVRI
jgi:hypothetical protein